MGSYQGIGVGRGAAVGPVRAMKPPPQLPDSEPVGPSSAEDLQCALADVEQDLRQKAQDASGDAALVLEVTAQMAGDQHLLSRSIERVECGIGPAHAVDEAIEEYCQQLSQAGGYLAERVTDLRSVKDRVIALLLGVDSPGIDDLPPGAVVVAADISAADIAGIDLTKVAAIVTQEGGPTGHTALIAAQMGLPCVVGTVGVTQLADDTTVIVDAATGRVTANPSPEMIREVEVRQQVHRQLAADATPGATKDGHRVKLLANVGSIADVEKLNPTGEGIGLFRTEVLYLDRETEPPLAEQTDLYRSVLSLSPGADIVIRTLDAGSDKPLSFATSKVEPNPALGLRGYRLVRSHEAVIDRQLAAISAAAQAVGRQPKVMAPMIATPDEASEFAARARAHGLEQVGVMIEIPSAAIQAVQILAQVDFVSIGTNDLSQYTMAADRLEGDFSSLLDPFQPAVLDLIGRVGSAGRSLGKPVGVCGAAASDPLAALVLVGLGITSLSGPGASLALVRFALKRHTLAQCQHLAEAAKSAANAQSARQIVTELLDDEVASLIS